MLTEQQQQEMKTVIEGLAGTMQVGTVIVQDFHEYILMVIRTDISVIHVVQTTEEAKKFSEAMLKCVESAEMGSVGGSA